MFFPPCIVLVCLCYLGTQLINKDFVLVLRDSYGRTVVFLLISSVPKNFALRTNMIFDAFMGCFYAVSVLVSFLDLISF